MEIVLFKFSEFNVMVATIWMLWCYKFVEWMETVMFKVDDYIIYK